MTAATAGAQVVAGSTAGTQVIVAGSTAGAPAGSMTGATAGATAGSMTGGQTFECENDTNCPMGKSCYEGRCVDQQRCDEQGNCPNNQICIAGLCFDQMTTNPDDAGALAFDPPAISYSFAMAQQTSTRQADIVNIGTTVLNLSRVELTGSNTFALLTNLALPMRLAPGDRATLEVSYTADDQMPDTASIRVLTEEGVEQSLRLLSEIKVQGGNRPCLEIQPAQLVFGGVRRGQQAVQSFTLSACSAVPVQVTALRRGASIFGMLPESFQFMPLATPLVLQPGMTHVVDVTYAPRRAGIESGFIEVISNDAEAQSKRVDLTAIALPPELMNVEFHIKLSWDTDLTDVDMHLIAPNGQMWTCETDCYFSNGSPNWGDQARFEDDPFLDLDDVDGYGPENINLSEPMPGVYTILIHYYDAHGGQIPNATVEIINFGQVVQTFGPQRLDDVNDVWYVAEVEFPGLIIRPLGQVNLESRGGNICF